MKIRILWSVVLFTALAGCAHSGVAPTTSGSAERLPAGQGGGGESCEVEFKGLANGLLKTLNESHDSTVIGLRNAYLRILETLVTKVEIHCQDEPLSSNPMLIIPAKSIGNRILVHVPSFRSLTELDRSVVVLTMYLLAGGISETESYKAANDWKKSQ